MKFVRTCATPMTTDVQYFAINDYIRTILLLAEKRTRRP